MEEREIYVTHFDFQRLKELSQDKDSKNTLSARSFW